MTEGYQGKVLSLVWILHNITENPLVMTWIVSGLIIILSLITTRKLSKEPGRLQNIFEFFVETLARVIEEMMGKEGLRFLPLFGTLAIFILFSNIIGLLPGCISPTGNWNTTIALSLVVFFSTHYLGMRKKGILGYLSHFLFPLRFWKRLYLAPLNLLADILFIFIHMIGELARPFSLSIRLFANMYAKHITLVCLAYVVVLFAKDPILYLITLFIPLILPPIILGLGIITSIVQTLIFVILAMVYIAGAIEEVEGIE